MQRIIANLILPIMAICLLLQGYTFLLQQNSVCAPYICVSTTRITLSDISQPLNDDTLSDISQPLNDDTLSDISQSQTDDTLSDISQPLTDDALPIFVRVYNNNVYFYSAPSLEDKLFALIPTYYLRVLARSSTGEFYEVELLDETDTHGKIIGYVLAESVTPVDYPPVLPLYPLITVYALSGGSKLYSSPSVTSYGIITANSGQTMGYYGKALTENGEWYYVCYKGRLGYVRASAVSLPPVSAHPTPLEKKDVTIIDEEEKVVSSPNIVKDKEEQVQTALIILLALPLLVIVIVAFIPPKAMKKRRYHITPPREEVTRKDNLPRYFDDYI